MRPPWHYLIKHCGSVNLPSVSHAGKDSVHMVVKLCALHITQEIKTKPSETKTIG